MTTLAAPTLIIEIAWRAQRRLHQRWQHLHLQRRKPSGVVAIAVARELTIKGSLVYNRTGSRADFDVAVDLLHRQGARLAETMITHRFPLDRIGEAFESAADKKRGSIKVTVTAT